MVCVRLGVRARARSLVQARVCALAVVVVERGGRGEAGEGLPHQQVRSSAEHLQVCSTDKPNIARGDVRGVGWGRFCEGGGGMGMVRAVLCGSVCIRERTPAVCRCPRADQAGRCPRAGPARPRVSW